MKQSKISVLLILFLISAFLSACAGGGTAASSWPGLSADQDTIYLSYNQHVYAVDLATGSEKWRFPVEANNQVSFYADPVLSEDNQLLVGGYNSVLYSLDPETGQQRWNFLDASNRFIGSPLATEQGIYAPSADHNLYALNPEGDLRWTFQTEGPQWAQPINDPECECIYLPSMDHRLYAVDTETGETLWRTEDLGGSIVGTPAYGPDDILYVGTFASEILALRAENGEILWRVPTSGWVWSGPVYHEGRLYVGDLNGTFYALDAATGETAWNVQPDGPISEPPMVTQDQIYVTTEVGTVYALDFEGNIIWNQAIGGKLYSSPLAAGDLIVVAPIGLDTLLVALNQNGTQAWAFTPEQ